MITVNSFADRLKSKSVKNSIINNIARDFNLTPILAEAYFNQIKDYFTEHVQLNLTSGQVQRYIRDFEAVRLLLKKFDDLNTISLVTRISKSVVSQLLPADY